MDDWQFVILVVMLVGIGAGVSAVERKIARILEILEYRLPPR